MTCCADELGGPTAQRDDDQHRRRQTHHRTGAIPVSNARPGHARDRHAQRLGHDEAAEPFATEADPVAGEDGVKRQAKLQAARQNLRETDSPYLRAAQQGRHLLEGRLIEARARRARVFAYESDADHREKERDKTPREERDERAWRNFGLERCAHAEAGADMVGLVYQPEYAERVAAVRDDGGRGVCCHVGLPFQTTTVMPPSTKMIWPLT